jgi:lipopolysaccharide/colanic/teichoic acid biosynthesis glycosyltransferase
MTFAKRLFDIFNAVWMAFILLPVMAIVALLILVRDGRPIFYVSERMKTPSVGFKLIKFRTMNPVKEDAGVSGGDKSRRITKTGGVLRRSRLDELPQLLNVLKGDISFVGPRPPLRQYVESHPQIYSKVLKSRPGITGLASIYFSAREEKILSRCKDALETDQVYRRVCIPRKARLDLIYQQNRNICFDAILMIRTVVGRPR